ncbi:MAG TPA: BREX system ATP-binding domain-containing protein [Bryobacteraceae bacterium]|nr:BREX system ATP-binding domain-containing protein [Bryobacteraceae bacterium]
MSKREDNTTQFAMPLFTLPRSFAAGRYQIQGRLGEGGQKHVLLARDLRLDREVVLSVLKPGGDPASQQRLIREARALAALGDHPNIVTVFDIGEEAGCPYLVCQYVQGGSVADLLRASPAGLPAERVLAIAIGVCHALAYAHAAGIVHRDIKPANIWLTQDGSVKLGDFGLALRLNSAEVTMSRMLVGTATYISPEQATGDPAGPASDLYSLGVVLYELLTGRPPFISDNLVGVLWQHANAQPVAPSWHNPGIPPPLESLVLQLLAKNPAERPSSAAALAETLTGIAGGTRAPEPRAVPPATPLSRMASGTFVGREAELEQVRTALHDALAGQSRLVFLVGEPGSGKTHTSEQAATYAQFRGFLVITGQCYEGEGAPPFWPWVRILQGCLRHTPASALSAGLGSGAAALAEILPEIRQAVAPLPPLAPLEPAQARFRLFESVTTFLRNTARSQPLLVILDDLHWADAPSLLLLVFLARELRSERILLLGTFRDLDLGRRHPLSQALGDLARLQLGQKIALRGLTLADVGRFIAISTGIEPPPRLVAAVHAQTEGNPFFVSETVKLLITEGRLRSSDEPSLSGLLPEGVRDVIGRRLDQLSDAAHRALAAASVLGRDFAVHALQPVSEVPEDELLDALDEAVASRIIEPAGQAGRFRFTHALIREVLYDSIGAARRLRLHRRAGAVLESIYGAQLDEHAAELARHFLQSPGEAEKAIAYSIRAARYADTQVAYEESVEHYQRALEALESHLPDDERRRCEILLALGDAFRKSRSPGKSREIFERAVASARRLGDAEALAQASLGTSLVMYGTAGVLDELHVALLHEALERLPPGDSPIRARVLAQLSAALYHDPARRVPLSLEAVEMARRAGDPGALLAALYCRHVALVLTDNLEERRAVALEILRLAEAAGAKEMMLRAWYRLVIDAMEMGDIPACESAIASYARIADELRQPAYAWLVPLFRGNIALLQARYAECERFRAEAIAINERAEDPSAVLFLGTQAITLGIEQGRATEQIPAVEAAIEKYPMIPGNRAILAYVYAQVDRPEDARRELERATVNRLAGLPRDGSWIVVLSALAWVCWYIHHEELAAGIYPLLLPYAQRNIVTGNAAVGCGSVWRPLGALAATLSRRDEAVHHFEHAIAMNRRMGARGVEAGSKYELALTLQARGAPGDHERAAILIKEAFATAVECGSNGLVRRIQRLGAAGAPS